MPCQWPIRLPRHREGGRVMLIGLAPSVVIGEAIPFSLTYHSESWTDDANSANPSFAGMAIGDAHSSRIVAVGVVWAVPGSATLTSATIGGVAADLVTEAD